MGWGVKRRLTCHQKDHVLRDSKQRSSCHLLRFMNMQQRKSEQRPWKRVHMLTHPISKAYVRRSLNDIVCMSISVIQRRAQLFIQLNIGILVLPCYMPKKMEMDSIRSVPFQFCSCKNQAGETRRFLITLCILKQKAEGRRKNSRNRHQAKKSEEGEAKTSAKKEKNKSAKRREGDRESRKRNENEKHNRSNERGRRSCIESESLKEENTTRDWKWEHQIRRMRRALHPTKVAKLEKSKDKRKKHSDAGRDLVQYQWSTIINFHLLNARSYSLIWFAVSSEHEMISSMPPYSSREHIEHLPKKQEEVGETGRRWSHEARKMDKRTKSRGRYPYQQSCLTSIWRNSSTLGEGLGYMLEKQNKQGEAKKRKSRIILVNRKQRPGTPKKSESAKRRFYLFLGRVLLLQAASSYFWFRSFFQFDFSVFASAESDIDERIKKESKLQ